MLNLDTHEGRLNFGCRLRAARKSRFESQASFAEAMRVTRDSVANWESGRRAPEVNKFSKICTLLDIDLGYLLSEYDESTEARHIIRNETGLSEGAIQTLQAFKSKEGGEMYLILLSAMIEQPELFQLIGQMRYFISWLDECEAVDKSDSAALDAAEYKKNSERYGVSYCFDKLLDAVLEQLKEAPDNG